MSILDFLSGASSAAREARRELMEPPNAERHDLNEHVDGERRRTRFIDARIDGHSTYILVLIIMLLLLSGEKFAAMWERTFGSFP